MSSLVNLICSDVTELSKLENLLLEANYSVNTYTTVTDDTLNKIKQDNPNLVIVSLNLNNHDGIDVCYRLKRELLLKSFVVIYSSQKEDFIEIEAFKAGADDYISKQIKPRLFLRKIHAILKRKPITLIDKPEVLKHKSIIINKDKYLVETTGNSINLPKKDFEILYLLVRFSQKVFTRKEIYNRIWNKTQCDNYRVVDVHIRKIRSKLGNKIIKTIKGVGYQLGK